MPSLVCNQFSSSLLEQLRTFRENNFLCDVRLVTDNRQEFVAHRLILSAASSFFRELFRSKIESQDISTVHLRNCSGECVRAVLHFLYSGELQLRDCDPLKVLNVAKACKIDDLQTLLAHYDNPPTSAAKSQRKFVETKVELDRENEAEEPRAKKPKRTYDLVQKFCHIHSLIGCNCFCSENDGKQSSDVFVPTLPPRQKTEPVREKSIKNTGVNADISAEEDLASVQIPDDDKEGWCRNKKYIKKTPTGYQCAVCKKTYGRYNSVSYHVTIYHRNPPIQCDQSGCTFSTREARYIHFHKYYRHDIPLPSSIDLESRRCPFCKHVAKSPAMLEKHIGRHLPQNVRTTARRNYRCEICAREFSNKPALSQHVCEKFKSCDLCSYKCRTDDNLQQHKMFKHGGGDMWRKNYQCDECSESFPSQFNLLGHKRRVHNCCDESVVKNQSSSEGETPPPPPPPPSHCSSEDASSLASGTTGFVTAAADPPTSVVDYGIV